MLVGVVLVIASAQLLLADAQLSAPADMSAEFQAALALVNAHYNEPAWRVSRYTAALAGLPLAMVLVSAGVRLIVLNVTKRQLLVEPEASTGKTVLGWFLGLSPSVLQYLIYAPRALFGMLLSGVIFNVAVTNLGGAHIVHRIGALVRISECLGKGPVLEACIPIAAQHHAAGMLILVLSSIFLLPLIGSLFERIARRCAASSAAQRIRIDQPPILFLRTFSDDQTSLPSPRGSFVRFLVAPSRSSTPLDTLLLTEFLHLGPPIAIGKPSEQHTTFRPFGSVRRYLYGLPWDVEVRKLMDRARFIVIAFDASVPDATRGISRELAIVGEQPYWLSKTIFVAHPTIVNAAHRTDEIRQTLREMWTVVGGLAHFQPAETSRPLILLRVNGRGETVQACTATRADATSVLLGLRAAFSSSHSD